MGKEWQTNEQKQVVKNSKQGRNIYKQLEMVGDFNLLSKSDMETEASSNKTEMSLCKKGVPNEQK